MNNEAANLQLKDKKVYEEKVREYIDKYATKERYESQFGTPEDDEDDGDDAEMKDEDGDDDIDEPVSDLEDISDDNADPSEELSDISDIELSDED